MITAETATVYRGGGRRWFSKKTAIKAEAAKIFRDRVKPLCDCDSPEYGDFGSCTYPGNICQYHDGTYRERFTRRVARLIAAAEIGSNIAGDGGGV